MQMLYRSLYTNKQPTGFFGFFYDDTPLEAEATIK